MRLIALFLILSLQSHAQAIDNLASFRDEGESNYFRLHYDNDYFSAGDLYYTQGINLEFVNAGLKRFPLNFLLLNNKKENTRFGISAEHNVYTPTTILKKEILDNDRPYSACLFLKWFSINENDANNCRVSSAFSLGIIGPQAFGGDMQTYIHRKTNNPLPQGWHNQIRNDVIINYEINHEYFLINTSNIVSANTDLQFRLGTLNTSFSGGITIKAGIIKNKSGVNVSVHKFRVYIYEQPLVIVTGYDATLQGGLFNDDSPYILTSGEISRIKFLNNTGIIFKIGKVYLEYLQSFITKEFATGKLHHWGGVKIGVGI